MASRSFRRYVEQELGSFPHFLIYAVLEWTLILILFIDGFLAFFANEFAKFFELRIPCLICTRIDHVLVKRTPNFYYNDSICEGHKKDVSYLAYCHVHKKLSDIRKMCEGCLLSFATEKESDCGTYKSLVGILHKDLECFVDDDKQINLKLPTGKNNGDDADADAVKVENSSVQRCSCCGEPLKGKSFPKGVVHGSGNRGSSSLLLSGAPAPSPRAPFVILKNEEPRHLELPHIRYTELKFMTENESENHEDEDTSNSIIPENQGKENLKAATVPLLIESDELSSPSFIRSNRFFGIPLTDSASSSPRWVSRLGPRRSPLEKADFSAESIEGIAAASEVDGESILHRLKRQVRLDRKSLIALYMELDEERSASAVAANNAMAMITRLQAEKAAVQMEALQYQRMMEEQAEYDQEDLQAMRDMLNKREEDIKVLEAELEAYREKYGPIGIDDIEECENEAVDGYQELKSQTYSPTSEKSGNSAHFRLNDLNSNQAGSPREPNGGETRDESSLDFQGETKANLTREGENVKALEEDSGLLNDTVQPVVTNNEETTVLTNNEETTVLTNNEETTVLTNNEETTILTGISHKLKKLQNFVKSPFDDNTDA